MYINNMKKVIITGGAGYCGSFVVPYLLKLGYEVKVYDLLLFGSNFFESDNKNLKIVKGDIRDSSKLQEECKGYDIFINLACISNDPSVMLDENLSKSINLTAFEPMVIAAKNSGIKKFVHASSSSVYGISEKKEIQEDHELKPITLYNKFKGMVEPILFNHTDNNFIGVIFRPATVCGYAPRLRLDLTVNILTNYAYFKKEILVFGGNQLRPNLNIKDYTRVLELFIKSDSKNIKNQTFNVGTQNLKIIEIAQIIKQYFQNKKNIDVGIKITKSEDIRSYHINSDKIKNILGFEPKYSVEDAVESLVQAFDRKLVTNTFENDIYNNTQRLLNLKIK